MFLKDFIEDFRYNCKYFRIIIFYLLLILNKLLFFIILFLGNLYYIIFVELKLINSSLNRCFFICILIFL